MKLIFILITFVLILIAGCKPAVNATKSSTTNLPAIEISSPSALDTSTNSVTFTITYSNVDSISLSASDVSLVTSGTITGTISVSGTGNTSRTVTVSNITGIGTLGISLASNTAINTKISKSTQSAVSGNNLTIDQSKPTISISSPSLTATRNSAVTYTVTYSNATAISLSSSLISVITTGTARATTVTVSGSGTNTRQVNVSGITGDGTLAISIGVGSAVSSDGGMSNATGSSESFIVDNTSPTVSVSSPSLSLTRTGPVTYTVTYSEAATISLDSSYITLNKTGTANGTLSISGTSSTSRTVTISSITGSGTLGIKILASSAQDAAGNNSAASSNSSTVSVSDTVPNLSISAPSLTETATTAVSYTLTYTGTTSVTLNSSKVTLNKTGTANATISVSGSGASTRLVTLSSITGNGTLGINVASGTGSDSVGNLAVGAGPSTTFTVDNTKPTVAISSPSLTSTSTDPVDYTVTYTGASTVNLSSSNVTLQKTGTANGVLSFLGSGETTRTIRISSLTGEGTIGIIIAAGSAVDSVSNSALSASSTTFTVDNTPPTITIGNPSIASTTTGPVTYTVTYSGATSIGLNPLQMTLNKTGTADGTLEVSGSDSSSRTVTISNVTGNGSLGFTINAGSAVDAANNSALASTASTTFTTYNDPLYYYQWHLKNIAQNTFTTNKPTSGFDLNLTNTWAQGYQGQGITILVSDTGVESAHEDLNGNFKYNSSHDFINGTSPNYTYNTAEPVLSTTDPTSAHGTAVAGIIAAVGGNGIGGSGIAPKAKIASANFLESQQDMLSRLAQISGTNIRIVNQSWGMNQCTSYPQSEIQTYIDRLAADRKVYVKSAGNDFDLYTANCGASNVIRHGSSEFDPNDTIPYVIVVGAVNAKGVKSSYSSPGANLWISGFGGEFGDDDPAIMTTDLSGCTYGMSPAENLNSFQTSSNALNKNCNYTNIMNGTSSAAPTVSGVIALILSANPSLTTRDVKHIIASTATKIDANIGVTTNKYATSPTGHIYEQGWITNAAGFHFHNYYGFGLINTDAAVAMATSAYTPLGPELQSSNISSGSISLPIPDNSATGVTSTISVTNNYTIESVQITPNITHSNLGNLGIELTSPSGTKSIIVNVNNSLEGFADYSGEVFLSNAFYGENSLGTWTIKIIDGKSGSTGTLNAWTINVIGH